jgi:hypothetical protein
MAGGYSKTKTGTPSDLGIRVRSTWEANFLRLLKYLQAQGTVLYFGYEEHLHIFPGSGATKRKNDRIRLDVHLAWCGDLGEALGLSIPSDITSGWIEVKGRLKVGGCLAQLDMSPTSQLATNDHDSRIVLGKFQRHYPAQAKRTWLIGEAEYKALCARYKGLVPYWESPRGRKAHANSG